MAAEREPGGLPAEPFLDPGDGGSTIATSSLGGRAAAGVAWLTLQKWAVRIFGFITIAILTRYLAASDFGTVAAASTVLPFFYLLSDLGFAAYVVQAEKADAVTLSTSFWFSALAGVVLFGLLVLSAPVVGGVFGSGQVVPVLQAMSVSVLLTALAGVPTAVLRRQMRFRALALQSGVAALVAQAVAVTMTLTGYGVWALVGQVIVAQAVTTVLVWVAARWRPGLIFSRAEFAKMVRFGTQVLGVEFVAMTRAWAEAAIVSAALGLSALGYLNIAQRLVAIVQDLTGAALIPVSTVAFAKLRQYRERLRQAYIRALRLTYALIAPPLVLLAVAAALIIPLAFGQGWVPSNQATQILALAGTVSVGASLDNGLFYGLGKPGRWFAYALATDVVTVATTAVCTRWGITGVATGFLCVCLAATIGRWFIVSRLLSTPVRVVAAPFGFLAVSVVVGGLAGLGVLQLTAGIGTIWSIILVGLTIGVCHLVVLLLLARPAAQDLLGLFSRFRSTHRIPFLPRSKEMSHGPETS